MTSSKRRRGAHRVLAIILSLAVCLAMCACGREEKIPTRDEILKGMSAFSLPNSQASVPLPTGWTASADTPQTVLLAAPEDGSQAAVLIQFPKDGSLGVFDLELVIAETEENYPVSGKSDLALPADAALTPRVYYSCRLEEGEDSPDAVFFYGETDAAYYAFGWISREGIDETRAKMEASLSGFKEAQGLETGLPSVERTDTIAWFCACYALLTDLNHEDFRIFGGLPLSEPNSQRARETLASSWGILDRAGCDETISWLRQEGQRAGFAEDMEVLRRSGLDSAPDGKAFILEQYEVDEAQADKWLSCYGWYNDIGSTAIDAWDYCRAMSLYSIGYLAGFYSEAEALHGSLDLAREFQPLFSSWDQLVQSYLRGYTYWGEGDDPAREEAYSRLSAMEDGPYSVPYDLELIKSW